MTNKFRREQRKKLILFFQKLCHLIISQLHQVVTVEEIKKIHPTILPLHPQEWIQYRDLLLEAFRESPKAFSRSYDTERHNNHEIWKRDLENPFERFYVACMREYFVGIIGIYRQTNIIKLAHRVLLTNFYVRSEWRGRKIGKQLLLHALDQVSRDPTIMKVSVHVVEGQKTAYKLYLTMGFKVAGILRNELKDDDDKYYDVYVMEKFFTR